MPWILPRCLGLADQVLRPDDRLLKILNRLVDGEDALQAPTDYAAQGACDRTQSDRHNGATWVHELALGRPWDDERKDQPVRPRAAYGPAQ